MSWTWTLYILFIISLFLGGHPLLATAASVFGLLDHLNGRDFISQFSAVPPGLAPRRESVMARRKRERAERSRERKTSRRAARDQEQRAQEQAQREREHAQRMHEQAQREHERAQRAREKAQRVREQEQQRTREEEQDDESDGSGPISFFGGTYFEGRGLPTLADARAKMMRRAERQEEREKAAAVKQREQEAAKNEKEGEGSQTSGSRRAETDQRDREEGHYANYPTYRRRGLGAR